MNSTKAASAGLYRKIALIVLLVTGIPLLIAGNLSWWFGLNHFRGERTELFDTTSVHLAETLRNGIIAEGSLVSQWVDSSIETTMPEMEPVEIPVQVTDADDYASAITAYDQEVWPNLSLDEEPLKSALENPLTREMRAFMKKRPLVKEVLITNEEGNLIAASAKTSDFWQADEQWWQKSFGAGQDGLWAEGIQFDDSAEVFSIDFSIPIHGDRGRPIGVLKAVVDASPLIASLSGIEGNPGEIWEVVLGDGSILTRIRGESIEPLEKRLDWAQFEPQIGDVATVEEDADSEDFLFAMSPLLQGEGETDARLPGMTPLFVLIRQNKDIAFLEFKQQLLIFNLAGVGFAGICGFLGLTLARRQIVRPVQLLRSAARDISAASSLKADASETEREQAIELGRKVPETLANIKTGDEIEDLSDAFVLMSDQVLNYQGELRKVNEALQTDMQTIFEVVDEGLFLLTTDGQISSAYSQSLETIFNTRDLTGRDFLTLLRPLISGGEIKTVEDFLDLQFNPRTKASQLNRFNPLAEVEVSIPDEEGKIQNKILTFRLQRVLEEGAIRSVLVTVRDVTARVQAERLSAAQEEVRERQFSLLWEILRCDSNELRYFITVANKQLDQANDILRLDNLDDDASTRNKQHKEKAQDIYRLIHSIKSHSGALQLDSVSKQCGKIESALKQVQGLVNISGEQFLAAVVDIAELRNQIEEVEMLIDRMASMPRLAAAGETKPESAATRMLNLLGQAAQSVADRQGKRVHFDHNGSEFENFPEPVLQLLEPALMQLVRNSSKHGIESPEVRVQQGKPSTGKISIEAHIPTEEEPYYVVEFHDDGIGLPLEDIRRRIVELGFVREEELERMSDGDCYSFLLQSGFTMCEEKDEDGGQGIGMDIVRKVFTEDLKGKIWIRSEGSRFAHFTMKFSKESAAALSA